MLIGDYINFWQISKNVFQELWLLFREEYHPLTENIWYGLLQNLLFIPPTNFVGGILGLQRYAKKRIAIWKTRIAIHIAIYLVSLFLSITAPSSVLWYNSRVMKLASYYTLSYFQLFPLSLGCFSRRNDRICAFPFRYFAKIIHDCLSAIFFETESSCFLLV